MKRLTLCFLDEEIYQYTTDNRLTLDEEEPLFTQIKSIISWFTPYPVEGKFDKDLKFVYSESMHDLESKSPKNQAVLIFVKSLKAHTPIVLWWH